MTRTVPLDGEEVYRVVTEVMSSNCYICRTAITGDCIIIDPGLGTEAIMSKLSNLTLKPSKIFCTHGHFDHIGSAAVLQEKFGSQVFLHSADVKLARSANFLLKAFRFSHTVIQPEYSVIEDGLEIDLNGAMLRVHHTPGHTDGSCIIEYGKALFTGDTIYSREFKLSQLPGGKPDLLRESIYKVWNLLTDDRIIFPGHGDISPANLVYTKNHALLKFLGMEQKNNEE